MDILWYPVAANSLPCLLYLEKALAELVHLGKWVRLSSSKIIWQQSSAFFVQGRSCLGDVSKDALIDKGLDLKAQDALVLLVRELATVVECSNDVA